ncbi:MAG: peptidase [Bacteroidetes bacterium]|jgi:Xaa-Pro aminopeptidase|nr:peptidase [Bacteroidota bacterium]
MSEIKERVALLREAMKVAGVSAYIVPGTDPHASEYIAGYWKERQWISGFTGSAGTAALTLDKAGLWTDSRYFLQGAAELEGTGYELMKMGLPETPDMLSWICSELKSGDKVGVNAQMFSVNAFAGMKAEFAQFGIEVLSVDLPAQVWTDRPALPKDPFFVFGTQYTGKSATEKLTELRAELKKLRVGTFILSALDDIAWLFNIRGKDVSYNPVVISYALVEQERATLFLDSDKLTDETKAYLASEHITIAGYNDIYKAIAAVDVAAGVLIDGTKLNQSLYEALPAGCVVRNTMSPVFKMKSLKNEVEMAGVRRAMIKDGVALTRFFMWLEEHVKSGKLTEMSVDKKLYEFRSSQEGFMGESFGTIAGYAAHGAIVHYGASPDTDATLKPEGIFLLDSGGQYLDGTTDITRTVALGAPTIQQKIDFTLVLKGHIALATAQFPVGTRGSQLDILARKAMWDRGLNYGHGTGHGVGHFLNVHEGPQNIRMDENPVTLQPGMFMSNEPGLYREGQYGIRTENLIYVVQADKTSFGQFLKFETITLFPIDQLLVDDELLTEAEIDWLNAYHKKVYDTLSPHLDGDEREWLLRKCSFLKK